MKLKILVSALLFICAAGAVQAQQSERGHKETVARAIDHAEKIIFMLEEKDAALDNHAFIVYTGDGYSLDASVEQREVLVGTHWVRFGASNRLFGGRWGGYYGCVVAGPCVLLAPRNGSIAEVTESYSGRSTEFEVDTLTVDFEKGKYYAIDRRLDADNRITFSIGETRPEDFTAFQRENPALLDGTWSGEKKNLQGTFAMRYIIGDGRVMFEGMRNKKPFTAEGRVVYNENTIILFPEKAVANGREVRDFASQNPYIWYYTLDGGMLRLEGTTATGAFARPFTAGITAWINEGELRKTN